jgi:hypothetical protein
LSYDDTVKANSHLCINLSNCQLRKELYFPRIWVISDVWYWQNQSFIWSAFYLTMAATWHCINTVVPKGRWLPKSKSVRAHSKITTVHQNIPISFPMIRMYETLGMRAGVSCLAEITSQKWLEITALLHSFLYMNQ